MTTRYIYFLFFCLTILGCKVSFRTPTPTDKIIQPEMDYLNSLNVDTVLIYTEIRTGRMFPKDEEKRCEKPSDNQAYYFFWVKKGKSYFTLRDDCYAYNVLPIDSGPFQTLYFIKDSLLKDSFISTGYFEGHYSADKLTLLDDHNDFIITFSPGDFYGNSKAVLYNKSTMKAQFRDNLKSYIDTLSSELILTRKRKNYR